MEQQRFHAGVEYRLFDQVGNEPCAWLELAMRFGYRTVPRFRKDDVLMFYFKHGTRHNFRREDVYEITGPGDIRTKVKYVTRNFLGSREILILRRLRRRATARAK